MSEAWLVPFKGRNKSGIQQLNFLYKYPGKNLYFMDNHRAASWCWEQHAVGQEQIQIIHIDAHSDAGIIQDSDFNKLPSPVGTNIDEYLDVETLHFGEPCKVVTWDNYIHAFYLSHPQELLSIMYGIQQNSSFDWDEKPSTINISGKIGFYLVARVEQWMQLCNRLLILNVDLDYFAESQGYDKESGTLQRVAQTIGRLSERENICITICLSPECCGGWDNAEKLLAEFNEYAGFDFALPS